MMLNVKNTGRSGFLLKNLKDKINRFFQERYGLDELGKFLIIINLITYILGVFWHSYLILGISVSCMIFLLYRIMSRQHWDRSEENRKYMSYVKLWQLRYEHRKSARIYLCRRCGRYIRVPKGKGKIQVTCTVCGDKTIHRT